MEYEITAFDIGKEPYLDPHGNTWATVAFLGISEPIKWVVKDPSKVKVGDKVWGKITDETSKAGKPYLRFRKEKRPDDIKTVYDLKSNDEYWADKQAQIKAQWAIGQAVQVGIAGIEAGVEVKTDDIELQAKKFYAMVDRVKDSDHTDEAEAKSLAKSLEDGTAIDLENVPL